MKGSFNPKKISVKFSPLRKNKPKTSCFYFRRADEKERGKEFFECGRYIKPAFKKEIERTVEYKTYSQEDAQLWVDLQVQKENELYAEFILR